MEYYFPIVCGRWDNGRGLAFMYEFMHVCKNLCRPYISVYVCWCAGASIPSDTMMHFPPCFRFPLFQRNFRTFYKFFTLLPFPEKFLDFHPPKFLMTFFFSHRPQISNFPLLFWMFQYISP